MLKHNSGKNGDVDDDDEKTASKLAKNVKKARLEGK